MKLPDLSKKQKILLASLLGAALLVALIVVIALSGRGAEETVALDEAPEFEDTGDTVAYDDTVDKVTLSSKGGRTQVADPVVTFRADAAHPMPEEGAVLNLGEKFDLGGSILANYPINSVTVHISCAHNNKELYPIRLTVKNTDGKRGAFDLREAKDGEASLVDRIPYDKFKIGYHVLRITASCGDSREIEVYKLSFYVVGEEWEQIRRENFPDSYPEALKFFKDDERFLYRYQWVNGRYILADPDWEKTYITTIPGYPNGVDWKMHVDAVPYMQKAFEYLETSYVRVHGTNGDTGVIPAIALITEYNGCYVSRFTSSLKSISHHTFGTAVDVNASMQPNKNIAENTKVIDDDVKKHLTYNGILEENGVPYYDYTYDGTYELDPNGVPQTCVNYILYELGFYRAGFLWAHYYRSTSDAMHFCLTEFVTYSHDDRKMGLRKVYEYAPAVRPTAAPSPEQPQGTQK